MLNIMLGTEDVHVKKLRVKGTQRKNKQPEVGVVIGNQGNERRKINLDRWGSF